MAISKRIRELVYAKYDGHCAYCGQPIAYNEMQVDHIVPLRRGDTQESLDRWHDRIGGERIVIGADDISNYNPSCHSCNYQKGKTPLNLWRTDLEYFASTFRDRNISFKLYERFGFYEYHPHKVVFYFEQHKHNWVGDGDDPWKEAL